VSSKVTNDRFDEYMDSIQGVEYPFLLPIFGDKVRERGYDLPKPAGLMLGYIYQKENIELNNLAISFRGEDELVDISDLVNFSKVETKVHVVTARFDVWVLPFLNVYGIYNRIDSYTDIALDQPIELVIPQINNKGNGGGFGLLAAYGWGPVFATANANMVWTKTPVLTTPTQSLTTSMRVGTHLWNKDRTHHISVWVGANYMDFIGTSAGSYDMSNLLPDDNEKLEDLQGKLQEIQDGINDQYNEFCSKPQNTITCELVSPIIDEFKDRVDGKLDGLTPRELMVHYSFNSEPTINWNMLLGAQYTLNKKWDFRFEAGFIGRTSIMFNVNYRFGMFRRKASVSTTSSY
jgi:hypothetical protein